MEEAAAPARRRRANNADARRREIIDEAARLFDNTGYTHANMDDIALSVGIAKPTLYHYFRSKDEILYGIYVTFLDVLLDRHAGRLHAGLDSRQLLLEIMTDILELMETHRGHVRALFEHHRELPPARWAEIRAKRDSYESMVRDVIREGVERGELREIDPQLATLGMLGMCNWAYQWYRKGSTMRPREIAYTFWNFIMYGFQANGGPQEATQAPARRRNSAPERGVRDIV